MTVLVEICVGGGLGFGIDCGVLRYVSVFVAVLGWF